MLKFNQKNSNYVRCVKTLEDGSLEWDEKDAPNKMTWEETMEYAESLNVKNEKEKYMNKITININGKDIEITLTDEQVAQITEAKPKLFEYEANNTFKIETDCIRENYNGTGGGLVYGRYRRTKEAAEMDFKRQTRMMRLAALAWEVGGCKEFEYGKTNYFVNFFDYSKQYEIDESIYVNCPSVPYMTRDTAIKVRDMLNSGEYSLDVE